MQHTREVVRAHRWPGRLEIIESDRNLGLSRSVIDGVTKLCREHGRVIVLEDDLLVAGGFLAYMNEALARYADEERVMTVSGHAFDAFEPEARAVFLPLSTTWGWATWSRAWAHFEEKPQGLKRLESPEVRRAFDLDGSYPYSEMMRAQLEGTIDSWGIRWYWTLWQRQGLGVFPLQSMIKNIGAGEGATHSGAVDPLLDTRSFGLDNRITSFPTVVAADEAAYRRWMEFIRVSRASGTEPPGVARFFGAARRLARRGASILRATLERREVG